MNGGLEKVVLNRKLADLSDAYLAMALALDIFNPKRDRWSEPCDFGNQQERAHHANEAIARLEQRQPGAIDDDMQREIETFRGFLQELSSGSAYDAEVDQFCWRLREKGAALADESVTVARIAT